MLQAKRYSICLEDEGLDGRRVLCELHLTPTGSFDTKPESYWMRLFANSVVAFHHTLKEGLADSLLENPAKELVS